MIMLTIPRIRVGRALRDTVAWNCSDYESQTVGPEISLDVHLEEIHLIDPNLPRLQGISLKRVYDSQSALAFPFDPHTNNDFYSKIPLTLHLLLYIVF